MLVILGSALAVGVTAGAGSSSRQGALVGTVRYGICRGMVAGMRALGVTGGTGCVDDSTRTVLPRCTVYQQERLIDLNGDFRYIHGESAGKDRIVTLIDPATGKETAYVILSGQAGGGVEGTLDGASGTGRFGSATKWLRSNGFGATGKVQAQYAEGVVYKFDSQQQAQDFLDARRGGIFRRSAAVLTGGRLDGLYDSARRVFDRIRGRNDTGPAIDGITYDLGANAEGSASYQKSVGAGVSGSADGKAVGRTDGQVRLNRDNTSEVSYQFEGELGGSGHAGASAKLSRINPLFKDLSLDGKGHVNGAAGYTIKFDKNGKPISFTMRTQTGDAYQGHAGPVKFGKSTGDLTTHTYTLDLTDPQNMQAFRDSAPYIAQGPAGLLTTHNPLVDRLKSDGVEEEQRYETRGDPMSARTPDTATEHAIKAKGYGLGVNDDSASINLRSARYIDHGEPGTTWQTLAKCRRR